MPFKDRDQRLAYNQKYNKEIHYPKNREKYLKKSKVSRDRLRRIIKELKEESPCTDCGKFFPYYIMDFDHVYGEKRTEISRLLSMGYAEVLASELAKSELACCLCHRIRTHQRMLAAKQQVAAGQHAPTRAQA